MDTLTRRDFLGALIASAVAAGASMPPGLSRKGWELTAMTWVSERNYAWRAKGITQVGWYKIFTRDAQFTMVFAGGWDKTPSLRQTMKSLGYTHLAPVGRPPDGMLIVQNV